MIVYLARDIRPFNVLRQWKTSLTPTILIESTDSMILILKDRKNILKMNKEVGMLLLTKELIQVE